MRLILICLILVSCSHQVSKSQTFSENLVTVNSALDHAQASYLKGCVDAYRDLRLGSSFSHCVEKAKTHRLELNMFMDLPVVEISQ